LLTAKEIQAEAFLRETVEIYDKTHVPDPGKSADLALQEKFEAINKSLSQYSCIFGYRYINVLKQLIGMQENDSLNNIYGKIIAKPQDEELMNRNYQKCFEAFFGDVEAVHVKVQQPHFLKNISPREAVILTMWSMVTAKRTRNDNMQQLIVCGINSSGTFEKYRFFLLAFPSLYFDFFIQFCLQENRPFSRMCCKKRHTHLRQRPGWDGTMSAQSRH